jgi:1,6-anhydro-N-acetylmuramate kinase
MRDDTSAQTVRPPRLRPRVRGAEIVDDGNAKSRREHTAVADLTYIDGDDLIACDTGPGNALLDDFVRLRTDQLLDTDGRMAQAGVVDEQAIARFLAHS